MSNSYWGYWLVVLGVSIIGLITVVNGITTTTTQDYLSIKEITDASMLEAVDYGYYRDYNEVRINKEKFMEVFIRRLAQNMQLQDKYEVNFYGIYEAPPKVSVEIKSQSGTVAESYDIVTRYSGILQVTGEAENDTTEPEEKPDPQLPTAPSTPEPSNPTTPTTDDATCKQGMVTTGVDTDLVGTHGITRAWSYGQIYVFNTLSDAMNWKNGYDLLNLESDYAHQRHQFKIIGHDSTKQYFAIEYGPNQKCGWVSNNYVAVNLREYLRNYSNVDFNITNATNSLFKVFGQKVNNLGTYDASLNNFVALSYFYAVNFRQTVKNNSGIPFTIYDAYRPRSYAFNVFNQVTAQFQTAYGYCSSQNQLNCYPLGNGKYSLMTLAWYINNAGNGGSHQKMCALDLTIHHKFAYSDIHELSWKSNKYVNLYNQYGTLISEVKYVDVVSLPANESAGYKSNALARELNNIMMADGQTSTIPTEWWHFEHKSCRTISSGLDVTKILSYGY